MFADNSCIILNYTEALQNCFFISRQVSIGALSGFQNPLVLIQKNNPDFANLFKSEPVNKN